MSTTLPTKFKHRKFTHTPQFAEDQPGMGVLAKMFGTKSRKEPEMEQKGEHYSEYEESQESPHFFSRTTSSPSVSRRTSSPPVSRRTSPRSSFRSSGSSVSSSLKAPVFRRAGEMSERLSFGLSGIIFVLALALGVLFIFIAPENDCKQKRQYKTLGSTLILLGVLQIIAVSLQLKVDFFSERIKELWIGTTILFIIGLIIIIYLSTDKTWKFECEIIDSNTKVTSRFQSLSGLKAISLPQAMKSPVVEPYKYDAGKVQSILFTKEPKETVVVQTSKTEFTIRQLLSDARRKVTLRIPAISEAYTINYLQPKPEAWTYTDQTIGEYRYDILDVSVIVLQPFSTEQTVELPSMYFYSEIGQFMSYIILPDGLEVNISIDTEVMEYFPSDEKITLNRTLGYSVLNNPIFRTSLQNEFREIDWSNLTSTSTRQTQRVNIPLLNVSQTIDVISSVKKGLSLKLPPRKGNTRIVIIQVRYDDTTGKFIEVIRQIRQIAWSDSYQQVIIPEGFLYRLPNNKVVYPITLMIGAVEDESDYKKEVEIQIEY